MTQMDTKAHVTLVGAGLSGSLMATSLGQVGFSVDVYEKRSDMRSSSVNGGKSVNLALSTRGIHALQQVGLSEQVLAISVPMRGRMIHDRESQLTFQPYSKNPNEVIHSISRGALNRILTEAADLHPNVRLHFEHRCEDVDLETGSATFVRPNGSRVKSETGLLVGADGAFSAVRARMQRTERFDYQQDYLLHGYKELCIPPTESGDFALEPNALHIWPRGEFMMIALPNLDRSFTCTVFWPFEGRHGFNRTQNVDDLSELFARYFPDALDLMPTFREDFFRNPTGSLVTVRCGPWYAGDRTVLIGDACHAVVPFYGQGMNAAFEDTALLQRAIDRHGPDYGRAFREFYQERKRHADALADLAIANFVEMRDYVSSPVFLLRKRVERMLHKTVPGRYTPLYSMVTFSRVPYATAVEQAQRQDWLIDRVFSLIERATGSSGGLRRAE